MGKDKDLKRLDSEKLNKGELQYIHNSFISGNRIKFVK